MLGNGYPALPNAYGNTGLVPRGGRRRTHRTLEFTVSRIRNINFTVSNQFQYSFFNPRWLLVL